MKLDKDSLFNIAIYLNPNELKNLGGINKKIYELMDERFWQRYLYFKFKISEPIPELTFKETADEIYKILDQTQKANKYFTLQAFIILLTSNQQVIANKLPGLISMRRYLIGCAYIINGKPQDDYPLLPDVHPSGRYINHWGFNYIYNSSEHEFIKEVDKYVHNYIPYITFNGLKYIKYDLDRLLNIAYNPKSKYTADQNMSEFIDHLVDLYRVEEHLMVMRYFNGHF